MNKNYTFIEKKYIEDIKSTVSEYRHIKSGARVLTIENEDINKVFGIAFRTTPTDDTGVPHILEHSTLCGSKKFPVKDPFTELIKSSLTTFINAMTAPDMTIYPVASCNLKDFKNLMEVYMDAVFYPNVYKREEIFRQEGWRYELKDKDSDIEINGVVYNEMKGAFSNPIEVLFRRLRHELYPDNTYGCESGGDPEFIPDLTYENFLNFHKTFYSPANSYIFLYGKMDMDERLEWMDKEYLSYFDKIEVNTQIEYQKPFNKIKISEFEYPIGKNDDISNKTYYSLGISIDNYKNQELILAMNILEDILISSEGAPIKQALLDKGLGVDISSQFTSSLLQPALVIISKDAPANRAQEFYDTIINTCKEVIKNGIDKKQLLATLNYFEFKAREKDFGRAPMGLIYMFDLSPWIYEDTFPGKYLEYTHLFKALREKIDTDYFEKIIETYIINNNFKALVTLNPSTTYLERKNQELKDKLKKLKDGMSDEEINKLIEDTKHLKIYQETPSTKEELATMPKLSKNDISKDEIKLSNEEEYIDNTLLVRHMYNTNGIDYINLSFDAASVDDEDIPYIGLLTELLGYVDTKKHTYLELDLEKKILTGGISTVNTTYEKDGKLNIRFELSISCLDNNLEKALDLTHEIMYESKFTDKKRISEILKELQSLKESRFINRGDATAIKRAESYINEVAYYNQIINEIDAYRFIAKLNKNLNIDELSSKLNKLCQLLFRKDNLIISYTSLENTYKEVLPKFLNKLNKDIYPLKERKLFKKDIKNEGLMTPSQIQYVAVAGSTDKLIGNEGIIRVAEVSINNDYLYIKTRVQGGAYGVSCSFIRPGIFEGTTYRDPNLENSIETFLDIPTYLSELNLTEEELTNSIIAAIGPLDAPRSPRAQGNSDYIYYQKGITAKDIQKIRDQIINCSLEDIKKVLPIYVDAIKNAVICVVGNEQKIENESKYLKNKVKLME